MRKLQILALVPVLTYDSKQIRPPIYSLKQSKLRKRRVIRYAILYFILLVVFLALIVGPVVAGNKISTLGKSLSSIGGGSFLIIQPVNLYNNDTTTVITGTNINPGLSAPTFPGSNQGKG